MAISEEAKQRLRTVMNAVEVTVAWGFIPFVLFLGFRRGADRDMPPLTLLSLFWQ
ncbi:hypothetical protein KR200_000623 [Drosophila serrata]|nr:hypothetical protein KR200_000623 [Drosophila serrata]